MNITNIIIGILFLLPVAVVASMVCGLDKEKDEIKVNLKVDLCFIAIAAFIFYTKSLFVYLLVITGGIVYVIWRN